jgi:hypothetical protein
MPVNTPGVGIGAATTLLHFLDFGERAAVMDVQCPQCGWNERLRFEAEVVNDE